MSDHSDNDVVCSMCKDCTYGQSILSNAISLHHDKCLKAVIDSGIDITYCIFMGKACSTILHAICWGTLSGLKMLLDVGLDPNVLNVEGNSPIYTAIKHERGVEFVEALIDAGADVHLKGNYKTCLSPVVFASGSLYETRDNVLDITRSCLKLLLKVGANPNGAIDDLYTPLEWAIICNNAPSVRILIDAGAKVNTIHPNRQAKISFRKRVDDGFLYDETLFDDTLYVFVETLETLAIQRNRSECLQMLIDAGVDISSSGVRGESALDFAKRLGRKECVEILEKALANKCLKTTI